MGKKLKAVETGIKQEISNSEKHTMKNETLNQAPSQAPRQYNSSDNFFGVTGCIGFEVEDFKFEITKHFGKFFVISHMGKNCFGGYKNGRYREGEDPATLKYIIHNLNAPPTELSGLSAGQLEMILKITDASKLEALYTQDITKSKVKNELLKRELLSTYNSEVRPPVIRQKIIESVAPVIDELVELHEKDRQEQLVYKQKQRKKQENLTATVFEILGTAAVE